MNDNWSKYYTPLKIAESIIEEIPKNFYPKYVLDICVGGGNFLKAANKRWSNSKFIGCDINETKTIELKRAKIFQIDALNIENLTQTINLPNNAPKLILANPPFGKYKSKVQHSSFTVLDEATKNLNRIEANMLISNISILNKGDYFGAILPENFFSSIKFKSFKKEFLRHFEIIKNGVSDKYFHNSEVKTRIFIGKFKGVQKPLNNNSQTINENISCTYQMFRGIDNSLIQKNYRTSINTTEVIHFNNLNSDNKKLYIISDPKFDRLRTTTNDLLILRVGRNSGKCFTIDKNHTNKIISDHFYIVKNIKLSKNKLKNIQQALISKRKGITAKYICKSDIVSVLNELTKSKKIYR